MVEFKPALGWVFRDYLKDYSHWAYGDLDVFFGDLTKGWLEPSEMRDFDIVTYRYMLCVIVHSCGFLCSILVQFLCILVHSCAIIVRSCAVLVFCCVNLDQVSYIVVYYLCILVLFFLPPLCRRRIRPLFTYFGHSTSTTLRRLTALFPFAVCC